MDTKQRLPQDTSRVPSQSHARTVYWKCLGSTDNGLPYALLVVSTIAATGCSGSLQPSVT